MANLNPLTNFGNRSVTELPMFASSAHTHSVYDPAQSADASIYTMLTRDATIGHSQPVLQPTSTQGNFTMAVVAARRLVRVLIVDSNENIPLNDSVIYKGDEQLTDLNDQELFFEVDVQNLLKAHNEKRVKLIDKRVKDRTEYLEPAKIRDLKMVVVTIAQF